MDNICGIRQPATVARTENLREREREREKRKRNVKVIKRTKSMEWASMSSGAVQLKVRATSNVSGEWQIASVIAYPDEISLDDNTH